MDEQARRYPLAWPMHWKRTPPKLRRRAPFKSYKREVSVAIAIDRLSRELDRMPGARDVILSTNVPLGLRGMPLSLSREPEDTGVAVYLTLERKPLVFACDKWDRVADNIAAISAHLDSLRRIERYGVGRLDQAFVGYAALPPSAEDWRIVLGVGEYATRDQVDAAFIEKAKERHPDRGGSHDEMAKLTAARDLAREVLAG